ncbi:MAG: hypothetical protein ACK5Y2_14115 [Bdellovibrionales bacterium]
MFAAVKDLIATIAAVVILAYSTGHREWLWKQIAVVRQIALNEAGKDWGCPSIFNRSACTNTDTAKRDKF